VQVFSQQGGQRATSFLCTQCARQLGMIGGGGAQGGADPFGMLQNLIQQQDQGPGSLFDALSLEAQQAVMRAREASAGTTRTAAIGTDHLLAGIVTGENAATELLQRAGADVSGMRSRFQEFRGDPGEQIYTFTPSAKRALQLSFTAARQMGTGQVGSEHLLLGLLGEGDGNAYRILQQHGASDAEALRREILRLIQQGAEDGPGGRYARGRSRLVPAWAAGSRVRRARRRPWTR
jgi:ATP-dependent Clp protease ATP-binding subunit ClpC